MAEQHPNSRENLIPSSERSLSEARELGRKGGIASGRARRRKSDMKKALQIVMEMQVPDGPHRNMLEEAGAETTMEQAMALSMAMRVITKGDARAFEAVAKVMGIDRTAADEREQRARTERLKAETQKIKEETERKSGRAGADDAQAQVTAIADMINNPASERVLSDYLGGSEPEQQEQPEGGTE